MEDMKNTPALPAADKPASDEELKSKYGKSLIAQARMSFSISWTMRAFAT